MSDTNDVIGRLQRFWDTKSVHIVCPICRNDEFCLDEKGELYVPKAIDAVSGKRIINPDLMQSYAVYCINCGFILNFMKTILDGIMQPVAEDNASA